MELKHMLKPLPTQCPKGREVPKQNTFHGSTLLLVNAMEVFAGLPLKQFSSLRFIGQIIKITPKERIKDSNLYIKTSAHSCHKF